jgi:hypothetical protein
MLFKKTKWCNFYSFIGDKMRKRKMYKLGVLLITAVLGGCAPNTSSVTATCVTQPVLLGKIKRIHDVGNEQMNLKVPFSIERYNHMNYDYLQNTTLSPRPIVEENAYPELFKLISSPSDKIAVHEVYIRSIGFWVCTPFPFGGCGSDEYSWAVINGGIYHEDAEGNDTKK